MRYAPLALGCCLSSLLSACGGDGGSGITASTTGSLEITTTTTGPATHTGYTVSIDGGTAEALGINHVLTRSDMATGSHVVQLSNLPAGCTVEGQNPRTVTVSAGETSAVDFAISCVPQIGSIRVTTTISGPAPAGYDLLLDGVSQGAIAASATHTIEGLAVGPHAVGLSGLPANCALAGANPQPTTVAAGVTTAVSFSVTCTVPPAQTGTLTIATTTTGSNLDPDGYQVAVDGGAAQPIGLQGSIVLANVAVGSHSVVLTGLAPNCTLAGPNPQTVSLLTGATVTLAFAVQCAAVGPTTGSISIQTITTGPSPDPDGYSYSLDGQPTQPIGTNALIMLADLPAGSHSIALAGLAANCTLEGQNPRSASVVAGQTVEVGFAVTCATPTVRQWTRMESGTDATLESVWAGAPSDVYAVGSTSTGTVILRYDGRDWTPQAAPQGSNLYGVWGSSPSDVFAAGQPSGFDDPDGFLLHYDGSGWSEMSGPAAADANYRSVWGSSATDVFAVGSFFDADYQGLIARFDGVSWAKMDLAAPEGISLRDVHGTSSSDVWAVGFTQFPDFPENGLILHYDGASWTERDVGGDNFIFSGVWASAPNDVFAVGGGDNSAAVYHYDGQTWSPMVIPPTVYLHDVWGTSATDVYAVGVSTILHYDGTAWTEVRHAQPRFNGVWGSSPIDVFAVGTNGTIFHGTP